MVEKRNVCSLKAILLCKKEKIQFIKIFYCHYHHTLIEKSNFLKHVQCVNKLSRNIFFVYLFLLFYVRYLL